MQKQSCYEILGVPKNASDDQIRSAYKKLALKYHPDRNQNNKKEAEEIFKEISEAYKILSESRKLYDKAINHGLSEEDARGYVTHQNQENDEKQAQADAEANATAQQTSSQQQYNQQKHNQQKSNQQQYYQQQQYNQQQYNQQKSQQTPEEYYRQYQQEYNQRKRKAEEQKRQQQRQQQEQAQQRQQQEQAQQRQQQEQAQQRQQKPKSESQYGFNMAGMFFRKPYIILDIDVIMTFLLIKIMLEELENQQRNSVNNSVNQEQKPRQRNTSDSEPTVNTEKGNRRSTVNADADSDREQVNHEDARVQFNHGDVDAVAIDALNRAMFLMMFLRAVSSVQSRHDEEDVMVFRFS